MTASSCPAAFGWRAICASWPFPAGPRRPERIKALEIIRPAVESLPQLTGAFSETMDNLGPLDKQILVERHLISREHAAKSAGSGLVLNKEESLCVMINEEDHLRMQALRPGLQLNRPGWPSTRSLPCRASERIAGYSERAAVGKNGLDEPHPKLTEVVHNGVMKTGFTLAALPASQGASVNRQTAPTSQIGRSSFPGGFFPGDRSPTRGGQE